MRVIIVTLFAMFTLISAGCSKTAPPPAETFTILATTDLKDIEPLLPRMQKDLGFKVVFKFGSTMGSVEEIIKGTDASAALFANAKWLMTDPQGSKKVLRSEKTMISPIAVGVCESTAVRLGWKDNPNVTWKDMARAAGEGKLKYAMSNPISSNQGFMALMGVAAAVSGKGETLTVADVNQKVLTDFFKGYRGIGDNSTYLAGKFVEKHCNELNTFINYESWLMTLNSSGKLKENLVLVYPKEGVATADYPLLLLNNRDADKYQKVVDWLRSADIQNWLVTNTKRRPINVAVAAEVNKQNIFPQKDFIELPFTSDREVASALMDAYLNSFRRPLASSFVIDVSGSMASQGRINDLKVSLDTLASADNTLSSRMAALSSRETVLITPFSSKVYDTVKLKIGAGAAKEATLEAYRNAISSLNSAGNTALFDAVLTGLTQVAAEKKANPNVSASVVVFTDGESNTGTSFHGFLERWKQMDEDTRAIPIFTIAYGEGNTQQLETIAQMSGGKLFDAKKNSLYAVFKEIRAYQ